jgi:type IV pilus assembly protein PilM
MPKKIGLEIGTNTTKMVHADCKKNNMKILGYDVIDTLDGVFSIDDDIDILKMELPIKESMSRLNIKKGDLYISINNEKVIIRTRELPRVSTKEMIDVVRFEAENFLPYDINEFYIDYKVLNEVVEDNLGDEDEKETLFNVMIIAAPNELVDQYIALAEKLGLKLKLTTVYTEAINRYVSSNVLKEEKNTLLVDIGGSYTNMIMYQGYDYFANIKTDVGITSIKDNLLENHGFAAEDIDFQLFAVGNKDHEHIINEPKDKLDIIKNTVSKSKENPGSKLHNLQKKLERIKKLQNTLDAPESEIVTKRNSEYEVLIKEINRMVEFFKSRKYGTFVDQIFVFGGGSFMNEFIELLEESIGVESSHLPFEHYESQINKESFELLVPTIGTCIGGKS